MRTPTFARCDADQRQCVGQVLGHGVASGRLVYGEHNASAARSEPGARGHAAIARADAHGR